MATLTARSRWETGRSRRDRRRRGRQRRPGAAHRRLAPAGARPIQHSKKRRSASSRPSPMTMPTSCQPRAQPRSSAAASPLRCRSEAPWQNSTRRYRRRPSADQCRPTQPSGHHDIRLQHEPHPVAEHPQRGEQECPDRRSRRARRRNARIGAAGRAQRRLITV